MIVNGKEMNATDTKTVEALLNTLDLKPERVVVELNGDIINKAKYNEPLLDEKSVIEIVSFVGGG